MRKSYTWAGFLISLLSAGCAALPEKTVHTAIVIEAPRERVWEILIDNGAYPQWNPYHVTVEGAMTLGSRLDVEIHKPNGERVEIAPRVLRLVPFEELTWGGGIKGIFHGEHVFQLTDLNGTATRLVHKERFRGIAIPFASLEAIDEGYAMMNRALKAHAEALPETHSGTRPAATDQP
ncbi:MAG: SRPBCC domain-containing protein [Candidatus Thiodiazotropha sp.]